MWVLGATPLAAAGGELPDLLLPLGLSELTVSTKLLGVGGMAAQAAQGWHVWWLDPPRPCTCAPIVCAVVQTSPMPHVEKRQGHACCVSFWNMCAGLLLPPAASIG